MQQELFNGRYFEQKVRWKDLNAQISCEGLPEEELERLEEEGPKYQYGEGCLSDGVLGAWLAELAGLPEIIDRNMIESHLLSVFRYNFKDDLSGHANQQRPCYAWGKEGGLLPVSYTHLDVYKRQDGNRVFTDKELEDEIIYGVANNRQKQLGIGNLLFPGLPAFTNGSNLCSPLYMYKEVNLTSSQADLYFRSGLVDHPKYTLGVAAEVWNFTGTVPGVEQFWNCLLYTSRCV